MTLLQQTLRLQSRQTNNILERGTYAPGEYVVPLLIEGNSLFSSVWVQSMDPAASVLVRYFETTTGNYLEERVDIAAHQPITFPQLGAYGHTHQMTVTPFHNKPYAEVIVTGGSATFGVYVTVVDTFASDLDAALKFDNTTFVALQDKGIPIVGLDETTGKLNIIRTSNGYLSVNTEVGTPFYQHGNGLVSNATPSLNLVQFTIGAGIARNISRAICSSLADGKLSLFFDSNLVGCARTVSGMNAEIQLVPSQQAATGTVVTLAFDMEDTRAIPVPIDGFIYGSEVSV